MTIIIRPMAVADAPAIHAIRSEPSAHRFQPLRKVSLSTLTATIAARARHPLNDQLHGKAQWVIQSNGQTAGWISLNVTSREHATAAIGYTVGEAFRGRGLATAATQLLLDIAFDPAILALERLEAVAAVDNLASCKVLRNAGFQEEGVARGLLLIEGSRVDHMRYGLLRTDLAPEPRLPDLSQGELISDHRNRNLIVPLDQRPEVEAHDQSL